MIMSWRPANHIRFVKGVDVYLDDFLALDRRDRILVGQRLTTESLGNQGDGVVETSDTGVFHAEAKLDQS